MDVALTAIRSPAVVLARPINCSASAHFGSTFGFSRKLCRTSLSIPKQSRRRLFVVRATSSSPESSESGGSAKIAPLELESPIGQFLSQILANHPHLVPAAVDQQLEQLQTDRDSDQQKEDPPASGTDLVLYRRIAEVKANERRKALEEILYALVVQKFMDANISLTPSITPDMSGKVDLWLNEDAKLEQLHSHEAHEMIQNHLSLIMASFIIDINIFSKKDSASVIGAISERSSLIDFVVEIVGSTEDELAASVDADRKLLRISYNRLSSTPEPSFKSPKS